MHAIAFPSMYVALRSARYLSDIKLTVTSELMFEQYSVPSLAFCVDGMMSFYQNNMISSQEAFTSDGLVISFNTASTSIIPVLNGKGIMSHAKRLVVALSLRTRS